MSNHTCTLYRHFGADGALLYVGIAGRPGYRLSQHEERSAWWHDVARVDLERFESRAAALLAEEAAIWRERPKHNRRRPSSPRLILPLDTPPTGWPPHLSKRVYFINDSWAVTEFGIECAAGGRYQIEAHRLDVLRGGADVYDLPLHMAEKEWVHLSEFTEALEFALKAFPGLSFDRSRWRASIVAAECERRSCDAFAAALAVTCAGEVVGGLRLLTVSDLLEVGQGADQAQ